jgi:thiamine biosynthesis lipoprotein
MDTDKRQNAIKTFITLCLIAGLYYYVRENMRRPADSTSSPQVEVDGGYREIMGTFARVVVVARNTQQAKTCIDAGFDEMKRIDSVMSDYKADSELSKLNREAFGNPVKASPELLGILQKSVEFSRLSDGAFDITVGPLVDLWHRAGEANSMPDEKAIAAAKARVGYEKLILDANTMTLRFAVEGMRLDLGGIAKGYSVDKAVEMMKSKGAIAGMVDSGGNIRCFGRPAGRRGLASGGPANRDVWLVGVQDPNIADNPSTAPGTDVERIVDSQPMLVLKLRDMAVATSGDYRRFVTVAGKKVSHIIDTNTAAGANKLAGDTIIAKTAIEADALSTAVNVLGPEKGLALIESLPDIECVLITAGPEYKIIKSKGADAYLQ